MHQYPVAWRRVTLQLRSLVTLAATRHVTGLVLARSVVTFWLLSWPA